MKTYKQFIGEMSQDIGSPYSIVNSDINTRKHNYKLTHNDPEHPYQVDVPGVKIHTKTHGTNIHISTNDHVEKQLIHRAVIKHHNAHENSLPFEHNTQSEVDRVKGGKLPRGHAKAVIYHHMEHSGLPLVTSKEQFTTGHDMWRDLTHKALDDGHHVYHFDGKRLHKTNNDNIHKHLKNSFGKDEKFKNRHMIISKKPLDI